VHRGEGGDLMSPAAAAATRMSALNPPLRCVGGVHGDYGGPSYQQQRRRVEWIGSSQ